MQIVVAGIDHTTAPIALRERLAFSPSQIPQVLEAARHVAHENVLLCTCNRLEWYAVGPAECDRMTLLAMLSEASQIEIEELQVHSYYFTHEEAERHLFEVACGLQSLVLGEVQIQGQVAEALELAHRSNTAGPITSALFRAALVAGKRARSETGISRSAASVSHVAVQLVRRLFPRLNEASILLIGSGQMSELAARILCDNGARRLRIMNRTQDHAIELAQRFGAEHRSFGELADALVEADVVLSSTSAPHAIITGDFMQRVMEQRAGRPLLLIDIALPRDVDPAVAALPGVHLYNLDDLQAGVSQGIEMRMQEVEHVQSIIAEELGAFERWLRSLSVVDTISELRQRVEALRQQELSRTTRQLTSALSEREAAAIQELTTRLVNKLLHTPTLRLKEAAAAGQGHVYVEALRYLFDLEVQIDEAHNDRDTSQQAGDDPDTRSDHAAAKALARHRDNH